MAAVRDHGQPRVDHLARLGAPSAIGLDETSFLTATAEHPTLLVTGIMDLDTGRLVDVLPAHSATAVTGWLDAKPARWLTGIDHVVIDPYQPYATAVAAGLPDARLVVDHFHVIRLANAALDEVRRRTQQITLGHRGRKHDPLRRRVEKLNETLCLAEGASEARRHRQGIRHERSDRVGPIEHSAALGRVLRVR
jgi:transposase